MLSSSVIQSSMSLTIRVGILLATTIMIYGQDLSRVFAKAVVFSAGNIGNYVLVIPLLVLFIIYRKRKILLATSMLRDRGRSLLRLDDVLGIMICLLSVVIYIYGSSTLYSTEYHLLSLPIFVAGATMFLFNIKTFRHVFFAILILAYLQPPIGEIVGELAADLSWGSAVMVQSILSNLGMPITLEAGFGAPSLLVEGPSGSKVPFFVGEPSSGVYSTIGLSLFSLFFGYISRGKIWKKVAIFAIGFPIFFILNMFRIAIIVSLWFFYGEVIAESFHVVSGGIMVVIGTLVLLVTAEKLLKLEIRKKRVRREECIVCEKSRNVGESLCLFCGGMLRHIRHKIDMRAVSRFTILVLIALLASASQITTSTASPSTDLANLDISSMEGPETMDIFLPEIEGWNLRYAYRDIRIEGVLNQDAALAYTYSKNGTSETRAKPTIFTGVQISTGIHTWEGSMLTYPSRFGRPTATVLELKDIDLSNGEKVRLFVYQRPGSNLTEAVVYWFDKVPLRFGSEFEKRNVQIVLWTHMNRLAQLGAIGGVDDIEGIEKLFLSFANPIFAHWSERTTPLKQQSAIDAIVNEQTPFLIAGIIIPASLISVMQQFKHEGMKRLNKKAYDQMTQSVEKLIIKSIFKTNEKKSTGRNIAKKYEDLVGKSIPENKLMDTLLLARKAGLINDEISNNEDSPELVWKPNFNTKNIQDDGMS